MDKRLRSHPAVRDECNEPSWSDTEISILESARKLIAEEGYHKFSLRATAARSNIHLKSLQYYFPTRKRLLIAVVNYTLDNYYFRPYEVLFARFSATTPEHRFRVMIEFLLDDLEQPFTTRLFPELWALASHEPELAEVMDIFYVRHLASIEQMIRHADPRLSPAVVSHRACIIGMLIEGLLLIMGHGKPKHPQYEGLKTSVIDTTCDIAGFRRHGGSTFANTPGDC